MDNSANRPFDELYQLNFPDEPITMLLERYPEFREWFKYLTPQLMLAVEELHNAWDYTLATRERKLRAIAMSYGLRLDNLPIIAG